MPDSAWPTAALKSTPLWTERCCLTVTDCSQHTLMKGLLLLLIFLVRQGQVRCCHEASAYRPDMHLCQCPRPGHVHGSTIIDAFAGCLRWSNVPWLRHLKTSIIRVSIPKHTRLSSLRLPTARKPTILWAEGTALQPSSCCSCGQTSCWRTEAAMMGLLKQINLSSSSSSCSSVSGKPAANTKPVPPYYTMHSHPELIQLLPLFVPLRAALDGTLPPVTRTPHDAAHAVTSIPS